jgi:hypothetical protein
MEVQNLLLRQACVAACTLSRDIGAQSVLSAHTKPTRVCAGNLTRLTRGLRPDGAGLRQPARAHPHLGRLSQSSPRARMGTFADAPHSTLPRACVQPHSAFNTATCLCVATYLCAATCLCVATCLCAATCLCVAISRIAALYAATFRIATWFIAIFRITTLHIATFRTEPNLTLQILFTLAHNSTLAH